MYFTKINRPRERSIVEIILVLNLVVEMTREPGLERRRLHITGSPQLQCHPVQMLLCLHVHGYVVDLTDPHVPLALHKPHEIVPTDKSTKATKKWIVHQVEPQHEAEHPQKMLVQKNKLQKSVELLSML